MNYIGMISGTSMDGIDAVTVSIASAGKLELKATHCEQYTREIRTQLQTLTDSSTDSLDLLGLLDAQLGALFARAANRVREKAGLAYEQVRAIGSHGQTVRHRPDMQPPFSLQIGNPAVIAEQTRITTVADFRARDIAAGGQGAPLVPAFHQWMFQTRQRKRAVVNIGGIANVSFLPSDIGQPVLGFDTGPGNALLDRWIAKHRQDKYDKNGRWGASGKISTTLLEHLCDDPYFHSPPPKSTGPEYFNLGWLEAHLASIKPAPEAADVQATLTELTARSIAHALTYRLPKVDELYVCGGGSHNQYLMQRLSANLAGVSVHTTQALGLDPDWVEASAFAWLAHRALEGQPGNLPSVTGARGELVLGAIYKA